MRKRFSLIDQIDQEDKQAIEAYIINGAKCGKPHLSAVLGIWEKNKKTLYRALGKNLRVSFDINLEKDGRTLDAELRDIYKFVAFYTRWDIASFIEYEYDKIISTYSNHFVPNFLLHLTQLYNNNELSLNEIKNISLLFRYTNIYQGYIDSVYFKDIKIKNYTIKSGAKTIKTIGKLIKLLNFPHLDQFEEWRNLISNVTTTKHIKSKLVLSIHPLDFLSLSDNNCSWDSCYRFLDKGMHWEATISHMNSNCAIVAYLESSKPFLVDGFLVPNKQWREIIYVHKDIIAGGRSYPFESVDLTKKVLDITKDLVYNNLKWKYQYGLQEYGDMRMEYDHIDLRHPKYHNYSYYNKQIKLYIGSHGGYDDFIEHKDETFYCYRNYVPETRYIRLTGPLTCVKCGAECTNTITLLCDHCLNKHYCNYCHKVVEHVNVLSNTFNLCDKCMDECVYIIEDDKWINKNFLDKKIRDFKINQRSYELESRTIHVLTASEFLEIEGGANISGTSYTVRAE